MTSTKVRFISARTYPKHGFCADPQNAKAWAKWRGREIEVLLPPEGPREFDCGTPVVWRVSPGSLEALGLPQYAPYYVCAHQIEAD